jgi:N-acetylmuramoyl-L-alanine amidase
LKKPCSTLCPQNSYGNVVVALERRSASPLRGAAQTFGMLLNVTQKIRNSIPASIQAAAIAALGFAVLALIDGELFFSAAANAKATSNSATQLPAAAPAPTQQSPTSAPALAPPAARASIVVLDPAHGGTDLGARGTGGIHESDIVLEFAAQVRTALEAQGFQVVQTRQSNANPSFDDRSAMANAQRGAIFVSLHIASTGVAGTARVYVMNDLPVTGDATGLIPWDRAQAPFVSLSRKLGDLVQGVLAQRFKGSPAAAQAASVRQLRTTASPAIAVEISSVTVENRAELDHMAPGVADAIARGAAAFRPSYVVAANPGERP